MTPKRIPNCMPSLNFGLKLKKSKNNNPKKFKNSPTIIPAKNLESGSR